jgi:two-component system response regulator HydG
MEHLAKGHYDLLISDMRMPGMDGAELVDWARTNAAVDHVLLLTGDIASRDLNRVVRDLGVEFLRKPFRIEELLAAVSKVLETEVPHPRPN